MYIIAFILFFDKRIEGVKVIYNVYYRSVCHLWPCSVGNVKFPLFIHLFPSQGIGLKVFMLDVVNLPLNKPFNICFVNIVHVITFTVNITLRHIIVKSADHCHSQA